MRNTITIIGVLFFFFLGGYIIGTSQDFCARQDFKHEYTELRLKTKIKRLENKLKNSSRPYKMNQYERLLLKPKSK